MQMQSAKSERMRGDHADAECKEREDKERQC